MTGLRAPLLYLAMAGLILWAGAAQSWILALGIVNLGLISALMALGVNMQWGYAGLFNVGVMGFAALGGLAAVLVAQPPVAEAWAAGGAGLMASLAILVAAAAAILLLRRRIATAWLRRTATVGLIVLAYAVASRLYGPAVAAIESIDPARTGYLGGLGLPILLSWFVGGLFAAGAAWAIGHIALGLRSDYFAIATLGISEIVLAVLKNEDWLARGVKNVNGLPRPVPYEVTLQKAEWVAATGRILGVDPVTAAGLAVRGLYALLFSAVLLAVLWLAERALHSPWGRMMRAIRDNELAAEAMGKDVAARHRQVFILGSAVVGLAGAMLVTLDGQFTPGAYNPLRFTFLIWVMVIVGGSGNNWGAVLGGLLVWFVWIEAEPVGVWLLERLTGFLGDASPVRATLIDRAASMRLVFMGLILLLVMRFAPRGLIPERAR